MIKTLIADDNLYFVKGIINSILNKIPDIQVEYVTSDGSETLTAIESRKFDLVFLDLRLPTINGIDILDQIKTLNLIKIPKVIIVTGDMNLASKLKEYKNICNVILKTDDMEIMAKKVEQVVNDMSYEKNFNDVKDKIMLEISNMGYSIKHIGTKYLIESIIFIYESNNFDLTDNLENNVYKVIAYKHNKTIQNVKNSISKSGLGKNVKYSPKYAISDILTKIM